jgi:hypothetical protein
VRKNVDRRTEFHPRFASIEVDDLRRRLSDCSRRVDQTVRDLLSEVKGVRTCVVESLYSLPLGCSCWALL